MLVVRTQRMHSRLLVLFDPKHTAEGGCATSRDSRPHNRRADRRGAFTLVELLVVVGVLALLMAVLLPALSSAKSAAHDLKCRTQLRSVVLKFQDFAAESGVALRGDSRQLGDKQFRLEDFQESIYEIAEFWSGGPAERDGIQARNQPLMCPSGADTLERRANVPCSLGAVGPARNVSIGFNRRLDTRSRYVHGGSAPAPAILTDKILTMPDVPLVFDVDGEAAAGRGLMPYYSAPPLPVERPRDIYISGQFWYPSFRHRESLNVGFIGGHVLGSRQPLQEPWWRWSYQPD